jgi:hypothetical protein
MQRAIYLVLAVALGLGVAGDLARCLWIPLPALWIPLLTACYYAGILLAVAGFGRKIGLGAAVLAGVAHIAASMTACAEPISQQGEVVAFIVVGVLAGFLVKGKRPSSQRVFTPARLAQSDQEARSEAFYSPDTAGSGQIPIGFVRAVRAPLSAIESAGYVLEDSAFADVNHREVASIILNECHRLDVLIRLLEFGHARSPVYREVDLSSVLDEIIRCGEALGDAARITLRKDGCPGLRVICDSLLLEQAVLNLLANAIRVAEYGDEVIVSAHTDQSFAVIEISSPRTGVLAQLGITMTAMLEDTHLHPTGLSREPKGRNQ